MVTVSGAEMGANYPPTLGLAQGKKCEKLRSLRLDLRFADGLFPLDGFDLVALGQRSGCAGVDGKPVGRKLVLQVLAVGRGVDGGVELVHDVGRRAGGGEHGKVGGQFVVLQAKGFVDRWQFRHRG